MYGQNYTYYRHQGPVYEPITGGVVSENGLVHRKGIPIVKASTQQNGVHQQAAAQQQQQRRALEKVIVRNGGRLATHTVADTRQGVTKPPLKIHANNAGQMQDQYHVVQEHVRPGSNKRLFTHAQHPKANHSQHNSNGTNYDAEYWNKTGQEMHDMEQGHFVVVPGKMVDRTPPFTQGRYRIVQLLGSGTYGKVVLCEDDKYQRALVAVKLVRNDPPTYRVAANNEIRILHQLNGYNNTVKLLRSFEFDGHVSMTFELLGESIWSLLYRNGRGFPLERVQDVTGQILQALDYVHSNGIIHTDVKSENILIASHPDYPGPLLVKLVDFGCALYSNAWHPPIAGTMNYRSPESVLQAEWSYPVDLWGVGCVLVEMIIGRQLFQLAHDDVHLHMMQRVLGPIPPEVLLKGWTSSSQRGLLALGAGGTVQVAPCRPEGAELLETVRPLEELIEDRLVLDLARRLLQFDPNKRITARDALAHEFFRESLHVHTHAHVHEDMMSASEKANTLPHAHTMEPPSKMRTKRTRATILMTLFFVVVLFFGAWFGFLWVRTPRARTSLQGAGGGARGGGEELGGKKANAHARAYVKGSAQGVGDTSQHVGAHPITSSTA